MLPARFKAAAIKAHAVAISGVTAGWQ